MFNKSFPSKEFSIGKNSVGRPVAPKIVEELSLLKDLLHSPIARAPYGPAPDIWLEFSRAGKGSEELEPDFGPLGDRRKKSKP